MAIQGTTTPAEADRHRAIPSVLRQRPWLLAPLLACGASLLFYLLLAPASFTVLIVGLDARPGEGLLARTDAILLLNVRPRSAAVALLSIPRDLFLEAPGYGLQRVNSIYLLGEQAAPDAGMPLLRESIEGSFGIHIQRTLRLDFQGFVALVDALGGVEVEVARPLTDPAFPTLDYGTVSVSFPAGRQTLTGEQALIYARMRSMDDDYGRAARQQQIVEGLAGRLANPFNWGSAWAALQSSLATDLSFLEALSIGPALILNAGRPERLVIDRDTIRPGERGAEPDYEALAPFINAHFAD